MNKHKIEQMLQKTNQEIKNIQEQLKEYPPGHISCQKNGKYTKWYQVEHGARKYIPKEQNNLARTLVYKQYLLSSLHDLSVDQKALQEYLKQYKNYRSQADTFLQNPHYQEILQNVPAPSKDDLDVWAHEEYTKNTYSQNSLKYRSISGNTLRSKSEVIIDQLLFMHEIPYRYECELKLGESIVYPDFTIRHPITGEFVYWEHFGMMDLPSYSQKAFAKMQNYCANGYIPSINLITTFETSECPLDAVKVEKIILQYFENSKC